MRAEGTLTVAGFAPAPVEAQPAVATGLPVGVPTMTKTIRGEIEERSDVCFLIVPSSGTRGLAGIGGSGDLAVDADGTHRLWLEYEFG